MNLQIEGLKIMERKSTNEETVQFLQIKALNFILEIIKIKDSEEFLQGSLVN